MALTEIRERRRILHYRNLAVRQAVQMKNKIAVLLISDRAKNKMEAVEGNASARVEDSRRERVESTRPR